MFALLVSVVQSLLPAKQAKESPVKKGAIWKERITVISNTSEGDGGKRDRERQKKCT